MRLGAAGDPLYRDYHDFEWGVPVRDDRTLFEFLVLDGAHPRKRLYLGICLR